MIMRMYVKSFICVEILAFRHYVAFLSPFCRQRDLRVTTTSRAYTISV